VTRAALDKKMKETNAALDKKIQEQETTTLPRSDNTSSEHANYSNTSSEHGNYTKPISNYASSEAIAPFNAFASMFIGSLAVAVLH